jgi:hypothetical protein
VSYRIRTPKRDTTTYDRTVAQSRQQPVVRRRPAGRVRPFDALSRRVSLSRAGWRWVSGLLSLSIVVLLALILTAPAFYVTQIEVGGLRTVPAEEIFAQSGVADYHIFWVEPDRVAQTVAEAPGIATASVRVFWPSRVVVQVTEREPALVWEQGGKRYWVDVRGNLMPQRQDLPNLIRIYSEGPAIPVGCPGSDCPGDDVSGRVSIERDVVEGALQLKTRRADIEMLYYDPVSGLSFDDPRGWRAYFGVGAEMGSKVLIYEAIAADLQARGLQPQYIDVSNAQAPVYRLAVIPG